MNVTKQARGVRFRETGGPEVLKVENVEVLSPGPGEVRMQVKAVGLNRVDTVFRSSGVFPEAALFPSQIGYEASGVIESVGDNVVDFKVGDRVSVLPAFSNRQYGTYGDLILVPAYALVPFPKNLSFEEAASIWTTFIVAYGMLVDSSNIQPGQMVLINAASSSVGLSAIQIAKMQGAIPIALTTSAFKKEALIEAGAKHVVVTKEEDVVSRIQQITAGKGADVILDAVGGQQFHLLVKSAATHGKIYAYGMLEDLGTYPTADVVVKKLTIAGYDMIDQILMNQDKIQAATKFIIAGLESKKLRPVVAKAFAFNDVADAHRYLERNQQIGKVVLTV
ncbi:zinc-dependent alcohol dehydrogenase family protein [Chryseosolibacter indicus]|uniref:Zinc-dependent alcohol dehydrogenase family protein n=1 Tax=Chryseosolibacter indicus TaxID=2782351 RepID=A0ABS5VT10_9BACT|nr:zinc-dependent alcohol dehydrogenase family protein [Chryseosolibacter indicus]MBT1703970.1 zinc-dependent alcohol dehydrogenase family protein [Chryseosolibacter indicus]